MVPMFQWWREEGKKKRVNKHIIYSQRVTAPGRKIGKIKGMGCGVVRECF